MKFWSVLFLTLLFAAPSLAQGPFGYPYYGFGYGYPYFSNPLYGFPPRNLSYPYYGYYSGYLNYTSPVTPYYLQSPYMDQTETRNTDLIIDDLETDVRELTNEVDRLYDERDQATSPPVVYAPEPVSSPEPEEETPATPYIMILNDGRQIEAQGYILAGDTLWIVTPGNSIRVPMSDLNKVATRQENQKRGIDFPFR